MQRDRLQTFNEVRGRGKNGSKPRGGLNRIKTITVPTGASKAYIAALTSVKSKYGEQEFLSSSLSAVIDRAPLKVLAQLGKMAVNSRRQMYNLRRGEHAVPRKMWTTAHNPNIPDRRYYGDGFVPTLGLWGTGEDIMQDLGTRHGTLTRDVAVWMTAPKDYELVGLDDMSSSAQSRIIGFVQRVQAALPLLDWNKPAGVDIAPALAIVALIVAWHPNDKWTVDKNFESFRVVNATQYALLAANDKTKYNNLIRREATILATSLRGQ